MSVDGHEYRADDSSSGILEALLRNYHGYLRELFELQREALIERDGALAAAFAQLHWQMLACHIDTEDTLLIPLLAELGDGVRWPSDVYLLEHRKIMRLSARLIERLSGAGEELLSRRQSLRLLDGQHVLMHLLEHHEQREEKALVVELQGNIMGNRLDAIVREVEARWREMGEQQKEAIAACRRGLPAEEF